MHGSTCNPNPPLTGTETDVRPERGMGRRCGGQGNFHSWRSGKAAVKHSGIPFPYFLQNDARKYEEQGGVSFQETARSPGNPFPPYRGSYRMAQRNNERQRWRHHRQSCPLLWPVGTDAINTRQGRFIPQAAGVAGRTVPVLGNRPCGRMEHREIESPKPARHYGAAGHDSGNRFQNRFRRFHELCRGLDKRAGQLCQKPL